MQAPLLDLDQLESIGAIGYDDYLDLLGDVIRDIPHHLGGIRAAIAAGDSVNFRSRVHAFRGIISYFGCVALTSRLAALEHQLEVAPAQATAIHTELQDFWDRSLAAIKEWEISVPDFAPK